MLILGGRLGNDDGGGEEKDKKAIALDLQNKTLHVHHAFLYISLPSLHNYDVKLPSFTFYGGRECKISSFRNNFRRIPQQETNYTRVIKFQMARTKIKKSKRALR